MLTTSDLCCEFSGHSASSTHREHLWKQKRLCRVQDGDRKQFCYLSAGNGTGCLTHVEHCNVAAVIEVEEWNIQAGCTTPGLYAVSLRDALLASPEDLPVSSQSRTFKDFPQLTFCHISHVGICFTSAPPAPLFCLPPLMKWLHNAYP